MQIAVRPPVKAGIAVLGASALAITPIAVTPPDIKSPAHAFSSAAVALSASPSPIDFYAEVFERSLDNVGQMAEIFLSRPIPILQAILANQFANVETLVSALQSAGNGLVTALTEQIPEDLQQAVEYLGQGNVEGALNTLLTVPLTIAIPLLDVLGAVVTPALEAINRLNAVIQEVGPGLILGLPLAFAGPVLSGVGAIGTAIQNVINAAAAGDLGGIVGAIVEIPAVLADGILNGDYGPALLGILPAPGLLTPTGLLGPLGAGPIGFFLAVREAIADIIHPPAAGKQDLGIQQTPYQAPNTLIDEDADVLTITTDGDGSGGEGAGAGAGGSGDEENLNLGGEEGEEDLDLGKKGEENGEENEGGTIDPADLDDLGGDEGDEGEEGEDPSNGAPSNEVGGGDEGGDEDTTTNDDGGDGGSEGGDGGSEE
ncbi:PE-PGRS family protein [Mycolicibacterium phlei]|uniref:PE-PGRS family protein n=1 Tax=Mycolicibacterium phlei DSM 43239 = CCUG 21000 TaxID=1226750 RepID=A0A5N5UQZ6_MYCPH|nr:hypothetical protein [Mycolicibacterium phlei]VEG10967.1 PE-PGRS family protein [Mycobacteroides chelonae]AMO62867.1 hypothetical protein MPHLCCUG_04079 [Mycolicibacterium phlei]KAB7752021.1 hypothetical protein MPHL21000_22845 [Mycolicibacterium phlei DSM 43239 = CCUG 21000]KXW59519.1 hypothetical protein MPHL43072_12890 [Mycolicibacterium phlei DSM 43072]KXW60619.1 hypothetical protein MPHL43239_24570 [Mycolicibacterium phlei DSM 43239 = CCUG 21000]